MRISGSCFTYILENKFAISGTISKSYLNKSVSNIVVKSLGIYSPSYIKNIFTWKQLFRLSAIYAISGT